MPPLVSRRGDNAAVVTGRRPHVARAAIRASTVRHYYYHPAQRRRVYLPPRKVQELAESLSPEARAKLSDVGLKIADAAHESKSVEAQLEQVETIWRDRFESIVEPIVESLKEAVAEALEAVVNEATSSEARVPDADNEEAARGWVAAAVAIFAAAIGGGALGADLAHGEYAEAAKWAVVLLIALRTLFREE